MFSWLGRRRRLCRGSRRRFNVVENRIILESCLSLLGQELEVCHVPLDRGWLSKRRGLQISRPSGRGELSIDIGKVAHHLEASFRIAQGVKDANT
jgi:hypothetical protein